MKNNKTAKLMLREMEYEMGAMIEVMLEHNSNELAPLQYANSIAGMLTIADLFGIMTPEQSRSIENAFLDLMLELGKED